MVPSKRLQSLRITPGRRAHRLAEMAASVLLAPHKYLDRFLVKRASVRNIAAGFYFVGRKPIG